MAWPDIEAGPLPIGSADLISLQVAEDVATGDSSVFITGRVFGRVLFAAPTIYPRNRLKESEFHQYNNRRFL